jgi:predicted  nucleic acid-binding Zn-ribbon protein
MASTSTVARPRTRKPSVAVVARGPDLDALDRVLSETVELMTPMISRAGSARAKAETELRVLEADREALKARRQLVERHYQALTASFDGEERDIEATIAMYRNALLDGAEQQERTAA